MKRRNRWNTAIAISAATAVGTLGAIALAPAAPGAVTIGDRIVALESYGYQRATVMNVDGTGRRVLPTPGHNLESVSRDGSLFAGVPNSWDSKNGEWPAATLRPDGTSVRNLVPTEGSFKPQEFSGDGRTLYLTHDLSDLNSRMWELYSVPTDGSAPPKRLPAGAGRCSDRMTTSNVGTGVFLSFGSDNMCGYGRGFVNLFDESTGTARVLTSPDDVHMPLFADDADISPDGTRLALVVALGDGSQNELRILSLADNTWTTVIPAGPTLVASPDWSPDGKRLLLTRGGKVTVFEAATGKEKVVASDMWAPMWLPAPTDAVTRVHGADAVRTAIAASRAKFADGGAGTGRKANVAVLTRSDAFYDGLAGSGLAGTKGGPMLLTSRDRLDTAVADELTRTLTPGATVYLLGGTSVLGAGVESAVRARGFVPKRLSGSGVAETGVAIAREKSQAPTEVLVATAEQYYDALAAGAAAGTRPNTTVVLTWGKTLPAATRAYLQALPATTRVVTVGGPAAAALKAGGLTPRTQLTGSDAADTAVRLAKYTFTAPATVAVATIRTWQDALAGGALISGSGPLLLTDRNSLNASTARYLTDRSAYVRDAIVLGGPGALTQTVVNLTGAAISAPDRFTVVDSYNGVKPAPLG